MDTKQLIGLAEDLDLDYHIVDDVTQECWVEGDTDGVGTFIELASQYGSGYYECPECDTYFFYRH